MSKTGNKIIGIDLGTTNTCAAIRIDGKIIVINNDEGSNTTPSVVSYDEEQKTNLVGTPAKNQATFKKAIFSIKSKMGKKEKVELGEKYLTPQEISAIILGYV